MTNIIRAFHVSASRSMNPGHPLFPSIDWNRIEAGQYAVVDPVNTGTILYVSYQDYLVLVRVAMSNNVTLKVLAAPGETNPSTRKGPNTTSDSGSEDPGASTQNSPPQFASDINKELEDFFFPLPSKRRNGKRRGIATRLLLVSPLISFAESGIAGTLMVKLTDGNILKWLTMWHDRLHWWSRATVPGPITSYEVNAFGHSLRKLLRNNGINHIIQRFKISLFVVNAYLGGRKLTTTQGLGFRIRLANGLPAFLPPRVRAGIRFGNRHYIHIWTSIFNAYKGLEGKWVEPYLAKGSITQEHPYLDTSLLNQFTVFCRFLWRTLKRNNKKLSRLSFHVQAPFFTTKAGPNAPNSLLGAGLDAYLWYSLDRIVKYDPLQDPESKANMVFHKHMAARAVIRELLGVDQNLIRLWLEATGQKALERKIRWTSKAFALQYSVSLVITNTVSSILACTARVLRIGTPHDPDLSKESIFQLKREGRRNHRKYLSFWADLMGANNPLLRFSTPTLSRLHNLYEAAGKVRTIAIVDYWTNFVLKPLHDWMFEVLQCLPQDATFDQEGRVEEFAHRGYTDVFSYDLKSATDLIPLLLYKALFRHVMPIGILECWLRLLADRSFLIPKSTKETYPGHPSRIRYGTGQPMGALTSWASMALVHHALVLFAAVKAKETTLRTFLSFRDYLVLGDDIVIANSKVAKAYVEILTSFHIPIGLAKSHISETGMFNFANQTFVNDINVSPISMKEDLNAKGLLSRIALVMRMSRRGWKDMSSRAWLSHMLRALTNPTIWTKSLRQLAAARGTVPFLHWILASVLLPGTSRFGYTGLSVDPRLLVSTFVRKREIWSKTLTDLKDTVLEVREQALLSLFTAKWVDSIYQQFLDSRKRLQDFDTFVERVISVDIEWLFVRIFKDSRNKALERWATEFRRPLKGIQVSTKLPAVNTIGLLEIACGMDLDSIYSTLERAEKELPLIPEFSEHTLSAIFPVEESGMPSRDAAIKRAELRSMLRITSLLIMLEQIPSTVGPGQESGPITGRTSQSLNSSLQDELDTEKRARSK